MSFNTSISGLNAAQKDLAVTGNNIANAKSTGFKKSRGEFGDIYAVSAFGNIKTATGQGVLTQAVTQQFTQGNLDFTDNALDLAITGEGFFAFQPSRDSSETIFSRAGAMGVDKDGWLVNSAGQFLKAYPVDERSGTLLGNSIDIAGPVQLPLGAGEPSATTEVDVRFNLPSDAEVITAPFDYEDATTYNAASSIQVFDSLGNSHVLTSYYVKNDLNDWTVYYTLRTNTGDVIEVPDTSALVFDANGNLDTVAPDPLTFTINAADLGTGAADLEITMGIDERSTQYNQPFSMVDQSQDGRAPGQLTGLAVGEDGLVRATYSNGEFRYLGKIALADFRNPQGLKQIGNNSWVETIDSGPPISGEAGVNTFGMIQGGALEASNVDITEELVNLIIAQRNFQANARAIETNKALSDTITNIR